MYNYLQAKNNKMKSSLLFTFLLLGQILSAQSFTEVIPSPPFDSVTRQEAQLHFQMWMEMEMEITIC